VESRRPSPRLVFDAEDRIVATPIPLPDLGVTTTEMRLGKWLKAEGDTIARGDVLAEIEADKAVMELESFAAGTLLKRMAEEGAEISTGDVLAWIGAPGEAVPE